MQQDVLFLIAQRHLGDLRRIDHGVKALRLLAQCGKACPVSYTHLNVHVELFASGVAHDLILKAGDEAAAAQSQAVVLSLCLLYTS